MKKGWLSILLVIAVFFLLGSSINSVVNNLKEETGNIESKVVEIDANLERRAELANDLVGVVCSYNVKDNNTTDKVSLAREQLLKSNGLKEKALENANLSEAILELYSNFENDTKLENDSEFNRIKNELEKIEEEIEIIKGEYNEAVKSYNDKINTGTTVVVANVLDYSEKNYFE